MQGLLSSVQEVCFDRDFPDGCFSTALVRLSNASTIGPSVQPDPAIRLSSICGRRTFWLDPLSFVIKTGHCHLSHKNFPKPRKRPQDFEPKGRPIPQQSTTRVPS